MNFNLSNDTFNKILKDGIHKCPKDKRYVVLHVFSGQMAIYCRYYNKISEIAEVVAFGIIDPQGWEDVKSIYDNEENCILYCDLIGMVSDIHSEWIKHKDDPKPEPIPAYVPVKSPLEKSDHLCQFDPGEDICYFCKEPRPNKL